jgi:pyruvate dehydrogenase E1 component alpha subunit
MVAATAKKSTALKSAAAAAATASKGKGKAKPAADKTAAVDHDLLIKMYSDMLLIRRFEEKAGQLYGQGLIGGFCHLYIGQEAVVVGMQSTIVSEQDTLITSYRDHGHMLACGMDPKGVMAELTGRRNGYSHGKGGSMHMFSAEKKFYGGHGIVGACVPIGAGLGFAHKYNGTKNVSLTYYGDGAANQGQIYEAFNMAALWKLPVIFIIENNQYGMGTSVQRASASPDFYKRGEPFGIPGRKVDGMDVLAVREAGEIAVAHCRAGKGPYILQMETYRYRGHSMSDPAKYRTREEVERVRTERDPIQTLHNHLVDEGAATDDELKKIDQQVKKLITEAADFSVADPEPDPSELYTDVYA